MLTRVITNKDKDIMIPLFKGLVRPILEYGNVVWCPGLKRQIQLIENVQRKFTKRIKGLSHLEYEERLQSLRLPSLTYRRFRGDLIETFKILHDFYDPITTAKFFTLCRNDNTRGHEYKLKVNHSNTNLSLKFFTNRIVKSWNNLPSEAVSVKTLNAFKNYIDNYFKDVIYSCDVDEMY